MAQSRCASAPQGCSSHFAVYGTQYNYNPCHLPYYHGPSKRYGVQTCTIDSHEEAGVAPEVQLPKYTTKVPAAGENVIYHFSTRVTE